MTALLKRLFSLLGLLALVWMVRSYGAVAGTGVGDIAVTLGFLLLVAYVGGQVAYRAGVSRVTGYIVVGLLVGPGALGLVPAEHLERAGLLNDIAIAIIAFTAGGELDLSRLRGLGRTIGSITLVGSAVLFAAIAGAVLLLSGWLPFTEGRTLTHVVAVATVFGSIGIASSPAVAIAVITDSRARGPVSTTVLGVTVVKDVLVIVAFAAALAVAFEMLEPAGASGGGLGPGLAWEVGGSLLVGAALGAGVAAFLKWIREHMVLFTLGMAWLAVELAATLHLELLLLAVTAGFTLENLLPVAGQRFVESLEAASLPVYALFFSLAGASVHVDAVFQMWHWVLLLVTIRGFGLWLGTDLGARLVDAPEPVRRYGWLGFVSQAGVTLGMVTILERSFPGWGGDLKTLFVAMVAIHELVGPIAWQWALERTGEAGAAETEDESPAERAREEASDDAPPRPDDAPRGA